MDSAADPGQLHRYVFQTAKVPGGFAKEASRFLAAPSRPVRSLSHSANPANYSPSYVSNL
jgi:hypothetical protein